MLHPLYVTSDSLSWSEAGSVLVGNYSVRMKQPRSFFAGSYGVGEGKRVVAYFSRENGSLSTRKWGSICFLSGLSATATS